MEFKRFRYFALTATLVLSMLGLSPLAAQAVAPTLTSITPAMGTVAGGTTFTLAGSGFTAATGVTIGGVSATDFVVNSDTSITAKTPLRAGADRKIGRFAVVVEHADGPSTEQIYFSYYPIYETANIVSANDNSGNIVMGELASRSQGKPIARQASIAPLTVDGVDSLTGEPYNYIFERRSAGDFTGDRAYQRESIESVTTDLATSWRTTNYASRNGVLELSSDGHCVEPLPVDDYYCSIFGPDVYTEAFYAQAGQSVSFDWAASDAQDAFEIYGFLVSVGDLATIPTPSTANHTIAVHAQGGLTAWRTNSAAIPADGYYRFRMVNGTYDETGGEAIGSLLYLSTVVETGLANEIDFGPFSDWVTTTSNDTKTITTSSTAGAKVIVTSLSTGVCTVDSGTFDSQTGETTYVVTRVGTATGACSLKATQGASGLYAPASDVFSAFDIRTSAIAPIAPFITSVTGGDQTLTVKFIPPARDGGAAITNYEYQTDSGAWVALSPTSTATTFTITTDSSNTALVNGTSYSIKIRAVNSVGGGTASNAVAGTPNVPAAPIIADYSATLGLNAFGSIPATTNSGGAIVSWAISPTLPTGLTFNTSTGVISGSPTVAVTSAQFTVTATNSSSVSDTAVLTLTVADNRPPVISYSPSTLTLSLASSVTATPTNTGGAASSWAVTSGTLPTGLSISSSTGVISGTPTQLYTSASVTVTATNAGGSGTASLTISVTGGAPGAPTSLAFTFGSPNTTLTWSPPADDGGSPITSYLVEVLQGSTWVSVTPSSLTALTSYPSTTTTWSFRVAARNAIGTSSWAVLNYTPSYYSGPIVVSMTPSPLLPNVPTQVKIRGSRLSSINGLSVNGKPVEISLISDNEITATIPGLPSSTYDLDATYAGGAKLKAQGLVVVATLNSVYDIPPIRVVVTGFRPGMSEPSQFQRNKVKAAFDAIDKEIIGVTCVGFTQGPTILPWDKQVAINRGKFICDYVKKLLPSTPQKLKYKNTTYSSVHWRRAEVYFEVAK